MYYNPKESLYTFLNNNGVNAIDKYGLDRWYYDNLHTTLAVDVWSEDCKRKVSVAYIDFGPDHSVRTIAATLITLSIYTPGLVQINYTESGYSPGGYVLGKTKSCCKQDKKLLNWAWRQKYRAEKKQFFTIGFFTIVGLLHLKVSESVWINVFCINSLIRKI
jgi:hypothetical protein